MRQAQAQEPSVVRPYSVRCSVLKPASTVCPPLSSGYDSRPPSRFRFSLYNYPGLLCCRHRLLELDVSSVSLSFCYHHSWILDNPPIPILTTRQRPEHESDAIQHDTTDESTSNRTQFSPRNAMELLVYYLLRQTHWIIVGTS